jgi:septum site-determining protein MinD
MTRHIVVASGKGGVGKTTIAANLAVAFASLGKETVILDADIVMANLEIIMGLRNPPVALIDVLMGRLRLPEVIFEGPGGVKIIPAGISLEGFNERNMEMLRASLREIPDNVEVLVIDAPAGRDAAMVMDDGQEVLVVTTPQVSSVSDALKMKLLAEKMGAEVTGVIMNMVEGRSRELKVDEVESALDMRVISIIPEEEKVKEALAEEVPFVLRYPGAMASREVMKLASTLLGVDYEAPKKSIISRLIGIFR